MDKRQRLWWAKMEARNNRLAARGILQAFGWAARRSAANLNAHARRLVRGAR